MGPGWIVDCDPTLGVPGRDVDDALAIAALRGSGAPIAAITTVFGNAALPLTTRVARDLGARWAIPVHPGAARPGEVDTAAARLLRDHRGPVLGLGPCTNLAAALARGARWERLVLLGGTARRSPNVRYLHLTELNFALDPAAAARALQVADAVVPMEVCRTVVFTAADLVGLPDWVNDGCRSWLRLAPWLTGTPGFHPWDVLAAAAAVSPDLFDWTPGPRTLDPARWRRGAFGPLVGAPVPHARALEGPRFRTWWGRAVAGSAER